MQYSTSLLTQTETGRFSLPDSSIDFLVAGARQTGRIELEQFVREGFEKSFAARVNSFLPVLLGSNRRN